jgi:DNA-binding transcriptional MocR family regulator
MKPDKASSTPLYIQIREEIRQSITGGILKAGERLPPVTALAGAKEVTAATIRRALQDLIEEGLVYSHVGRGTFVTDKKTGAAGITDTGRIMPSGYQGPESFPRTGTDNVTRSLTEMMALAQKPGVIAFTRGIGDPETIQKGILTRLVQKALAEGEELFWDHGDPRGLLTLRQAISSMYREQDIMVSPEQVLVTSGSQQAIAIIAQLTAEGGKPVICETPCYSGVTNAFSAFGVRPYSLIRTEDGPDVSLLPASPEYSGALFYLCPVLHNPMGTDISREKHERVTQWAKQNRAVILSDEIYRDLHLEESQPRSFLKDPGPEHAIILGSLSKSFISGLRVGWIVTSEERIRALTRIKKAMDLGCPPLMQGIARAFLEDSAGYTEHRIRVREHYRKLRDTTLEALANFMPPGISWTKPQGGFQLWLTLPEGYSSVDLFLPGPLQDIDNRFRNSLRLCYGSLTEEAIKTGIKRLAEAVTEYLDESPEKTGMSGLGDF